MPVCEDTLTLFVTYLAQQNLSYATIQVYLSAVRYSGITTAKSATLRTPRLNYVLKGDQFRKGHTIYLGTTTHTICPVDALVQYLAIQGGTPRPLFLLPNNRSLTRASFSSALKKVFQDLHMDHRQFNIHSFRIISIEYIFKKSFESVRVCSIYNLLG